MAIAKGDFIALDYTARTQPTADSKGVVFDTTKEAIAHAAGIYSQDKKYGSVGICVGAGHVLPNLDSQLVGREPNTSFTVKLIAAQAFGFKDAKLIRLIPMSKFKAENTMPKPGLPVIIDGAQGIVKTVSSGRVLVDFNHPQAGKDVEYAVNIGHIIADPTVQLQVVLATQFKDTVGYVENNIATVTFPTDIPKEYHPVFEAQIKHLLPKLTGVVFRSKTSSSSSAPMPTVAEQKAAHAAAKAANAANAKKTVPPSFAPTKTQEHDHSHDGHSHDDHSMHDHSSHDQSQNSHDGHKHN